MTETLLRALSDGTVTEDGIGLLGRMLHRFRNSLTSVRGYAELLAESDVPEERRRQWATRIIEQLERIESLQSRLDAGRQVGRPVAEHSLGMVLRAAVRRSRQRLASAAAGIDVRFDLDGDLLVRGDGEALTEAVAALVDNACEATALLPGPERAVRLTLEQDADHWTVCVEDDGPGMTPDVAERVGTAFYSRKPGHLGLGTYLSRTYLQRHDLDLGLTNASDGGTVATIRGRHLPSQPERRTPSGGRS
ncbi:MAG TPA: HAMP domain-containing sensor histidine kinase [Candidatus Krumholzibacteria bacterium]|nr:HAMP domain-containing sensor histidine kinase [Candidatus Krumholzibacteria bacterium]